MICRQCARRLARQNVPNAPIAQSTLPYRTFVQTPARFATTIASSNEDTTAPRPHDRPAATSTSAAQPFTAGTVPEAHARGKAATRPRVKSIAPEGTRLKGLNFMKNQSDPVALPDDEYPDWLWSVLDKKEAEGGAAADGEGDLFSKSKKERRKAAKALRKQQLENPESLQSKVPLHEQTIEIYAGDGTLEGAKKAAEARQELTKAMRAARRQKIKTTNFLKAMK